MSETAPGPLTIMFWPESAYGPTNQCIGLADLLRNRGHRVVFASESVVGGQAGGARLHRGDSSTSPEPVPGRGRGGRRAVLDRLHRRDRARVPQVRRSEQLDDVHPADLPGADRRREVLRAARCGRSSRRTARTCSSRTTSCSSRRSRPAGRRSCGSCRATRWRSAAPASRRGSPGCRGTDRSQWDAFRAEFDRTHRAMWADFNAWVQAQGADALPELEFMPRDNAANLYVYPEEADYLDARPLDDSWTGWTRACARPTRSTTLPRRGRRPTRGQRARLPLARVRWAAPMSS